VAIKVNQDLINGLEAKLALIEAGITIDVWSNPELKNEGVRKATFKIEVEAKAGSIVKEISNYKEEIAANEIWLRENLTELNFVKRSYEIERLSLDFQLAEMKGV
jgi:hypothetical protein